MINQEIEFWRAQVRQGTLISALRAEQKRAISFFGAFAVFRQNEWELFRIIADYMIVNTDDAELHADRNRMQDSALAGLDVSTMDVSSKAKLMEAVVHWQQSGPEGVAQMKQNAQARLNRLFS